MNTVVESLRNLGAFRITAIIMAGIALLVIFIFLSMRITTPVMSPLYSDMSIEDGAKVVAQLDSMNVPYELRANGTQVLVPNDQVARLRMAMAGSGLPSRGSIVGYEIFDKSDALGTSSFVYNVNLLRALEGEISRTLASFSSIESARVHLVMPKRELFVKDKTEPSASVILKTRGNRSMSKSEVGAVSHFVSSAVPNLKPSRITIVSDSGLLLSRGGDDNEMGAAIATSQEYKASYENRLKSTIVEIVERSVGIGKVEAQVSADIDFDRIITNSETFDPNSQVARSIQTSEEKESSVDKAAQDVSVANNLPDAPQNSATGGSGSNAERVNETTNYEISKTVTNHIKESGTIKRITVAVLVDGNYTTTKAEDGTETSTYNPRSQEELDKLKSLVKSSIGFDEKRGDTIEVVNMQFSRDLDFGPQEASYDWLKRDFDSILKTMVIGIVAVLVILLVIKPLVNRAFEIGEGETGDEATPPAIAGPVETHRVPDITEAMDGIDIEKLQNRGVSSSIRKIGTVVGTNPEETLAVIRTWLNQK